MDKISSSRARRLKPSSRMQLSHHSSLLTRLRNRELFDEEETNQMQEEIKEVERTLRQIESKDVNELSISSNNRYTILKEHLALCHASLAPVYRLPAEIFSEIYHIILAIAHGSFPRPTEQLDPTRALISLAHVCSFWRKTCFFTVTLWCDIRIPSLFRNAGNARLVEMHLQYSGSSPLDIQIHNSGSKSNQTTANAILEGLFLNHERWRKIAIVGKNSWTELHSVCSRIYNAGESLCFPVLESLDLSVTDTEFSIFSTANLPRLRTLKSCSYNPGSFPFEQLTSLSLTDSQQGTGIQLPRDLSRCFPNLEDLHVAGDFSYIPNETGDLDVAEISTLSKLQSLTLELYRESSLTLSLTTLKLPALLRIVVTAPLFDWPHTHFISMLDRFQRGPALTKLSLRWAQITGNQLIETLHLLSNLEELIVTEDGLTETISPALLQAMTITSSTRTVVPKLRSLVFFLSVSNKERHIGLDMAASRTQQSFYQLGLRHPDYGPLKYFKLALAIQYMPFEFPISLSKDELQVLRRSMDVKVVVFSQGTPQNEQSL